MAVIESAHGSGMVEIIVRGPRGERRYRADNRLTNYQLAQVTQARIGNAVVWPTEIELGTGTNANGPQPTDTDLWTPAPATLLAASSIEAYMTYYAQWQLVYQTTQATGTWTEAALKDANGNLWAHVEFPQAVTVSDTETLTIIWKILESGN